MFLLIRRWPWILVTLLPLFLFAACGKKANPVIPFKTVPQKVERITYRIQEGILILSWAVPKQNTDGSPLTDLREFRLTRGDWPTQEACPSCPPPFKETLTIDLKGSTLPDLELSADLVQLRLRRLQPGLTYFFQVKAVSAKGAESEPSPTLLVSWEVPFAPPKDLTILGDPQGLKVSWKPSTVLADGTPADRPATYLLERRTENGPWETVGGGPLTGTVYTDKEVRDKTKYTYRVKALRPVGPFPLESEASEEKETVYLHLYPPPAVQDVIAFSTDKGVELRWQKIEGVEVSGYHIYRRRKSDKTAQKITAAPVKDTVFEDPKVTRGESYVYAVSPVGAAPAFLEGDRSKEVEITVSP